MAADSAEPDPDGGRVVTLAGERGTPGRLDALLERGYGRLGWRLPLVALAVGATIMVAVEVAGSWQLVRFLDLSGAEVLELTAYAGPAVVSVSVFQVLVSLRILRPLGAWFEEGCPRDGAADAWRTAHRLPLRLLVANTLVVVAHVIALAVAGVAAVTELSVSAVVVIVLDQVCTVALAMTAATFALQLLVRPLIRDVARHLDRPPLPTSSRSVRIKLLFVVPVIAVDAAFFQAWLTAPSGGDWGQVLGDMGIALAVVLPAFLPAAALLAHSTLRPLDDLLSGTERLKRGDFGDRVPELSADEYGVLARSFNDAMEGLAERQRLADANMALLEDVRASRARIVAAADAARQRVERNIHDGAQQRLVALGLDLRMIEDTAGSASPDTLRTMAAEAGQCLKDALDELRELARGLHPSVLETDGLPPALKQLASRAPIPVTVSAPAGRLPSAVESTAYFVASEALANVAKYAHASRATVLVEPHDGRLLVQISDDGIGGAHASAGSGLAGLVDRVAALDGTLSIDSPAGQGTTVTVELPLEGERAHG